MSATKNDLMKVLARALYLIRTLYYFIARPVTLGVRVILVKDGRVLLVKHSYQPYWFLAGGGVERGETLEEAARREAREEAGAKLGNLSLFGIYTNYSEHRSDHIVVFSCDSFELSGESDFEIEECKFFAIEDLPANTAPGHERRIREYLEEKKVMQTGRW